MEIIIKEPEENERIIIEVDQVTAKVLRAIQLLTDPDDLTVFKDNQIFLLAVTDVFYVDTIDAKTYVYTESDVYSSKLKLMEIEGILEKSHFLRISKQTLVNLKSIKSVQPSGGGRFKAELLNGDRVIISRQYVPKIKEVYGI